MKTCSRCKETKALDAFHVLNKAKDGCQSKCKVCRAAMADDWYRRKYPEKHAAIVRRREAEAAGLTFCYGCQTGKAISDFNSNKANRRGLQCYCKECMRDAVRGSIKKNRAYYNDKATKRYHAVEKLKSKTPEIIERRREIARNYYARNPQYQTLNYRNEPWLVVTSLIQGMRQRSKRRAHPKPAFTNQEFEAWLEANGFNAMHSAWLAAGHDKWMKPSVDRLNNSKPYTFDNMRLVTWRENLDAWISPKTGSGCRDGVGER